MANIRFTLANGTKISVDELGEVWQGPVKVNAADMDVGDAIGPGCGFFTSEIITKVTE